MENLVTFGDSLTDDGRADYWESHGEFPPPGLEVPGANASASGGAAWGRIVAETTGAKYNNYAVSGGTCSKEIVETTIAELGFAFPTVLEHEIPTFREVLALRTSVRTERQTTLSIMFASEPTTWAFWATWATLRDRVPPSRRIQTVSGTSLTKSTRAAADTLSS